LKKDENRSVAKEYDTSYCTPSFIGLVTTAG